MASALQRPIPVCKVTLSGQRLEGEKAAALFKAEVDLDVDLFGHAVLWFTDSRLKLINGADFLPGTPVKVELGYASRLATVFEGEVTALEPLFRRDTPVTLRVVCLETLHRLALQTMTRSFNNVDEKEIVEQIAREHGLSAEAPGGSKEHVLQSNVSDAAFLRRLAQRQGQHLRVEGKKIILGDPPAGDDLVFAPGDGVRRVRVKLKAGGQVGEVSVHGYDPKTKREFVGTSKGEGEAAAGAKSHGGGASVAIAGHEAQPSDTATAERMARGRMRKLAEGFVTARLDLEGNALVVPGARIKLDDLGPKIDGTWRVEHARHEVSKHGYHLEVKAVRVAVPKPPRPIAPPPKPAPAPVPPARPPPEPAPPQALEGQRIEVKVVDPAGSPKPGFFFRLTQEGAPEQAGTTDAEGYIRLALPAAGRWKLRFPDVDGAAQPPQAR